MKRRIELRVFSRDPARYVRQAKAGDVTEIVSGAEVLARLGPALDAKAEARHMKRLVSKGVVIAGRGRPHLRPVKSAKARMTDAVIEGRDDRV